MRTLKHRKFHQWAIDEGLTDDALKNAISEIEQGLFEANLGGGLYKKRVAGKGRGKRGGYRTLIAFKHNKRAIFMYGIAKNDRENINDREKEAYKKLAKIFLEMTDAQLNILIKKGELVEVM